MDNSNQERQRILAMLEAGKITASECAALLRALDGSGKAPGMSARQQYLAIAGAGLVLIGFFLPWFKIDMFQELNRMMGQVAPSVGASQFMPKMASMTLITGGDVARGLGWVVLFLGLASGVLPLVSVGLDLARERLIRAVSTGIGALILVYLLTGGLRHASLGIWVVLGGYLLLGASLLWQKGEEDAPQGNGWDRIG